MRKSCRRPVPFIDLLALRPSIHPPLNTPKSYSVKVALNPINLSIVSRIMAIAILLYASILPYLSHALPHSMSLLLAHLSSAIIWALFGVVKIQPMAVTENSGSAILIPLAPPRILLTSKLHLLSTHCLLRLDSNASKFMSTIG